MKLELQKFAFHSRKSQSDLYFRTFKYVWNHNIDRVA